MEEIWETISTACEELEDIPLYEIIIETIEAQDDTTIFSAVLEWEDDLMEEIFSVIEPVPTARDFYEDALMFYFFKELEIYLGFNIEIETNGNS